MNNVLFGVGIGMLVVGCAVSMVLLNREIDACNDELDKLNKLRDVLERAQRTLDETGNIDKEDIDEIGRLTKELRK